MKQSFFFHWLRRVWVAVRARKQQQLPSGPNQNHPENSNPKQFSRRKWIHGECFAITATTATTAAATARFVVVFGVAKMELPTHFTTHSANPAQGNGSTATIVRLSGCVCTARTQPIPFRVSARFQFRVLAHSAYTQGHTHLHVAL